MDGFAPNEGAAPFGGPGGPARLRLYYQMDYCLWFSTKGPIAYPLLTAGTTGPLGTFPDAATGILFGTENLDFNGQAGGRATVGFRLPRHDMFSFETSGFILEKKTAGTSLTVGDQVLARPFINEATGGPSSLLVGSPSVASGTVSVAASTQLWGIEPSFSMDLFQSGFFKVQGLAGFRYMDLRETLDVRQQTQLFPTAANPFYGQTLLGGAFDIRDHMDARNQFIGGQVGFRATATLGRLTVDLTSKFAIGDSHQTLILDGSTSATNAAGANFATVPGGLYALASNIGRHRHDEFAYMPEGNIQFGWRIARGVNLVAGYNILYISRVARPGAQIDPVISLPHLPTATEYGGVPYAARPGVPFIQTDYWAMGGNFGITVRY
jgi:hypothetical protein